MRRELLALAMFCAVAFAGEQTQYHLFMISVGDKKLADEIVQKLQRGTASFADLAKQHSTDKASRDKGGDTGWTNAESLVQPLATVLPTLKPNQPPTQAYRVGDQWMIVAIADRKEPGDDEKRERERVQAMKDSIKDLAEQNISFRMMDLPPVKAATLAAPKEATDYNSAYQTSDGCIFFYKNTADTVATHAKWEGPACKGKAVSGKGTLHITGQEKLKDGSAIWLQHHMKGTFANGLLQGEGEKINYSYKADKSQESDAYAFYGKFSGGLLHGRGVRVWARQPTDHPQAVQIEGNFVDGVPRGRMLVTRSRPYPGTVGDVMPLAYGPEGLYAQQWRYNDGKPVEGRVFFDNGMWDIKFNEMGADGPIGSVSLKRSGTEDGHLHAVCTNWERSPTAWRCPEGELMWRERDALDSIGAEKAAFSVSTQRGVRLLRVSSNPPVLSSIDGGRKGLRCDPEWSACSGQGVVMLSGSVRWNGEVQYRRGEVRPVGQGQFVERDSSGEKVILECARLASPTECEQGSMKQSNGIRVEGGFRWKNVRFEPAERSSIASYVLSDNYGLEPQGWVKVRYTNGAWANARVSGRDILEVGDCDDPAAEGKFTCSLRGNKVYFQAERPPRVERPQAEYSWTPPPMPVFVPQPVVRTPYILPGMR